MSATRLIQTAIYARLVADATLMALTDGGWHNDIPDGAAYPHGLISKAAETNRHTFGTATTGLGYRDIIRIHIYSRYQGDTEAYEILDRVVVLLNFQPLTVTGYASVSVEYEQSRLLVEAIDKIETRHLIGEFIVLVHQ